MSMLRRGYGALRNLRCKSGARFPPSTDWMYLAKTYRRALGPVHSDLGLGTAFSHPNFS